MFTAAVPISTGKGFAALTSVAVLSAPNSILTFRCFTPPISSAAMGTSWSVNLKVSDINNLF